MCEWSPELQAAAALACFTAPVGASISRSLPQIDFAATSRKCFWWDGDIVVLGGLVPRLDKAERSLALTQASPKSLTPLAALLVLYIIHLL